MTAVVPPGYSVGAIRHLTDLLRAELRKLASLRSTLAILGGAFLANVVLGAVAAAYIVPALDDTGVAEVDPIRLALAGVHISQVALGVLGVLMMSGEHTTGSIRSTFAATPQRRLVLAAKGLGLVLVAWFTATAASWAGYLAFHVALTDERMSVSLADPGVVRALFGGGLYLTTLGLLGLGLGAILRSSAGAISTLLGIMFVPSILIGLLPPTWQDSIGPYLPMEAGSAIFIASSHGAAGLGPWSGLGVFAAYAAATLVGAFLVIGRRDV